MDKQRYVLITGANGGIGEALCAEFSANGYQVLATDCEPTPKADLAFTHYLPLDLQTFVQSEEVAGCFLEKVRSLVKKGTLHTLINNAATQILGSVDSLTRNEWQTTLDINLTAPFLLSKALVRELEAAKGSIVNISSIHARLTKKNFVAYATSKAALSGMTRALAVDLGSRVRVNCIEPAAIKTAMLKAGFEGKPELYAQLEDCHPLQRIGQPEEVARLALAIASGGMNFLHGACIGLDGGIGNRLYDPISHEVTAGISERHCDQDL